MSKRLLCLAIALLLALPALAVADSDPGKISAQVIEPTFFFSTGSYLYTGDEVIFDVIARKTNIKFKPIPVPLNAYTEKLNTTMASGDLPDLMGLRSGTTAKKFGPDGAFVNMSEYLDRGDMPNFAKMLDAYPPARQLSKAPDGIIYGGPRIYDMDYRVDEMWLVRWDVLNKHNIANPTTFEEVYAMLKQLKELYPDSTPYTSRWGVSHCIGNQAYYRGSSMAFFVDPKAGKYLFGPSMEAYTDALVWLRDAYKDGLLDKEFPTLSDEQYNEKFATGKAFMTIDYPQGCDEIVKAGVAVAPDWDFSAMVQPSYNGTRVGNYVLKGYYGYTKAISSQSKYKDELIRFIDWTYSPEGTEALLFGIEGEQFTKDAEGKYKLSDDLRTNDNPTGKIEFHGLNDQNIFSVLNTPARDYYEMGGPLMRKSTELIVANGAFGEPIYGASFAKEADQKRYNDLMAPINTYIEENSMKVVTGELDIAQWPEVLKAVESMGLPEADALINQAYVDTFGTK